MMLESGDGGVNRGVVIIFAIVSPNPLGLFSTPQYTEL
jgi:hypothetical protein